MAPQHAHFEVGAPPGAQAADAPTKGGVQAGALAGTDCTVVVDAGGSEAASCSSGSNASCCTESSGGRLTLRRVLAPARLPPRPRPAADVPGGGGSGSSSVRMYYIDWLRVFLTVLVLAHHCVTAFQSHGAPWTARGGDTALWLLGQLFVSGNQV